MSVLLQINRIKGLRDALRNKLVSLGLVQSNADLSKCVEAVNNIENQGSVSVVVKEGETYTVPRGFHSGSGTVSGVSGGGNYTLQIKEITPTKSQQNISSDDGYYGLSSVLVEAIPEEYQDVSSVTATANDVLIGKSIVLPNGFIVSGQIEDNGVISGEIDGLNEVSFTIPSGYTTGGTVSLTNAIEQELASI